VEYKGSLRRSQYPKTGPEPDEPTPFSTKKISLISILILSSHLLHCLPCRPSSQSFVRISCLHASTISVFLVSSSKWYLLKSTNCVAPQYAVFCSILLLDFPCRGREWVGAIPPLPQAPPWRVAGLLYPYCGTSEIKETWGNFLYLPGVRIHPFMCSFNKTHACIPLTHWNICTLPRLYDRALWLPRRPMCDLRDWPCYGWQSVIFYKYCCN
jgi:hypothetical protein